jgi:hypothetical protein
MSVYCCYFIIDSARKLLDTPLYDMNVYLGKDRQNATQMMTATHVTVRNLTRRTEGEGHELYMDNFFSSPDTHKRYHLLWNCQTKS